MTTQRSDQEQGPRPVGDGGDQRRRAHGRLLRARLLALSRGRRRPRGPCRPHSAVILTCLLLSHVHSVHPTVIFPLSLFEWKLTPFSPLCEQHWLLSLERCGTLQPGVPGTLADSTLRHALRVLPRGFGSLRLALLWLP